MKATFLSAVVEIGFSRRPAVELNTLLQATKSRSVSVDRHMTSDDLIWKGPMRAPPADVAMEENGCIDMEGAMLPGVAEDCTYKDFFIFLGTKNEAKDENNPPPMPTFKPGNYTSDTWWKTEPVYTNWKSDCVAYVGQHKDADGVNKKSDNCHNWCEQRDMKCVQGMDDVHFQTDALSDWLETEGYAKTDCTLLPSGHVRQGTEDMGCGQTWQTQICSCVLTTTTTPLPCFPPPSSLFSDMSDCGGLASAAEGGLLEEADEDCTNKKFFEFQGTIPESKDDFTGPDWLVNSDGTYKWSLMGAGNSDGLCGKDSKWSVFPVKRDGWDASCVAYVNKGKPNVFTCDEWCGSHNMKCQMARDDAHFQTEGLSEFLGKYDETNCTLLPEADDRQTESDNGCHQSWFSQICACVPEREAPQHEYECGCHDDRLEAPQPVYDDIGEDCTYKDIFEFAGGSQEVVNLTYSASTYGSDKYWKTHPAPSGGWLGASCVAYVYTAGTNCKDWCGSKGKKCLMGWDDAHHQLGALNHSMDAGGYDRTRCTYSGANTARQQSAENGCLQNWSTQMCACGVYDP